VMMDAIAYLTFPGIEARSSQSKSWASAGAGSETNPSLLCLGCSATSAHLLTWLPTSRP
jgi:hypothetical protein